MTRDELRGEAERLVGELFDGLPHDVPAVLEEPTVELLVAFAVRAVDAELAELKDEYIPKLNWSVITVRELIAEIDRRRAELSPEGEKG